MKEKTKKLNDKEKYIELKEKTKNEELKQDDKENLIMELEQIIIIQENIIKFSEIILIPLFIATLGFVLSRFNKAMLTGTIIYFITSLIEILVCFVVSCIAVRKKYFAEKMLKLIEKN